MEDVHAPFCCNRYSDYADSLQKKSHCLDNVVGFIDGKNISISRQSGAELDHRVVYNGHRGKQSSSFKPLLLLVVSLCLLLGL